MCIQTKDYNKSYANKQQNVIFNHLPFSSSNTILTSNLFGTILNTVSEYIIPVTKFTDEEVTVHINLLYKFIYHLVLPVIYFVLYGSTFS